MSKNIKKDLNALLQAQCSLPRQAEFPITRVLSHGGVILRRPRPEEAARFFQDFGLEVLRASRDTIWLKGGGECTPSVKILRGPARFLGIQLRVQRKWELETLARKHGTRVQNGDPVRGGLLVELKDPDGMIVQATTGELNYPTRIGDYFDEWNAPGRVSRVNRGRRPVGGPPLVYKPGHSALGVSRMGESLRWYQENFGFIVSDFQMLDEDPLPVAAFLRCDRDDEPTDHHTLALVSAVEVGHNHSAFELQDLDSLAMGHAEMRSQGYAHSWGPGRHHLGSQIFDYWRDREGDMFEHYIDGDLFNSRPETGYHPFHKNAQHQWGPDINADFTGSRPGFNLIKTVCKRLLSSDDLTLKRLKRILKAAS